MQLFFHMLFICLKETPTHNLRVYEMRGSWNKETRTVLIGLYDGYQKSQAQKRNLSSEALKGFKVEEGSAAHMVREKKVKFVSICIVKQ